MPPKITNKPLIILPEKPKNVLTCLFVGGPADGEMLEIGDREEWVMQNGGRYTRQLVKWGTKYYAVFLSEEFRYEDLMARLLVNYQNGTGKKREITERTKRIGRKFDFSE